MDKKQFKKFLAHWVLNNMEFHSKDELIAAPYKLEMDIVIKDDDSFNILDCGMERIVDKAKE